MRRRIFVVPVHDEEVALPAFLAELAAIEGRFLFVDDGSTDSTPDLLAAWCPGRPARLVSHGRNLGMSAALRTGLSIVAGEVAAGLVDPDDVVVTLDADGQIDPTDAARVADHLEAEGLDAAAAHRDFRLYPLYKRVGNALLTASASLLSGHRYRDVECGLRALRAGILAPVLGAFTGMRYSCATELGVIIPRLGFRIRQDVPIGIRHYRLGAGPLDGFQNLAMGPVALLRALRTRRRLLAST